MDLTPITEGMTGAEAANTILANDGYAFNNAAPNMGNIAALTTTPPLATDALPGSKWTARLNGIYTNFGALENWNEVSEFYRVGATWTKRQVTTLNGITPQYNQGGITAEHKNFMKYVKAFRLVQGFDPAVRYFIRWIRYKNEGYTGIMLQINSLPSGTIEFQAVVNNVTIAEGIPLLIKNQFDARDRWVEVEFSRDAPAGFTLNGTFYQDSLLQPTDYNDDLVGRTNYYKEVANTTMVPDTVNATVVYPFGRNGVYTNFGAGMEIWNERGYFRRTPNVAGWVKQVTDAGDFDIIADITPAVGNTLRKNIARIKLVEGFDLSKSYFIKRVAYKEGGETGIYLLLQSLPAGAFEFEWRISNFTLTPNEPITLTDVPRGRTVRLTISTNAPATFNTVVTYYQDSLLSTKAFYDETYRLPLRQIVTTRVTVPNTSDYAIRTLVHSLASVANYYNRYVVFVPNGRYFEMDIRTVDYVDVEGETAEGVIIGLDGDSTKIAPADLSIGTGGVPINTIPTEDKHIFWHVRNAEIRNVTLEASGGSIKYCIHQDNNTPPHVASCRNVIFDQIGAVVRLVGIGGWAGQTQQYIDCYFKNKNTNAAVGWHNWTGQIAPANFLAKNCRSVFDFIVVDELGSGRADVVKLENVKCEGTAGANIVLNVVAGTPDPLAMPYYIKLVTENSAQLTIYNPNRPDAHMFIN